ncbi:hypothetical protein B0T25DRAFT_354201 [Lasiosphaeria hispida]|uniref:DUF7025 domain-containing protein n=1 Tax=Lasiosphaeria hispida TaxID=260671 RepID=A0AAJ0H710_9PEZI|nr:hypothetical protein B0T25DRAFT_354201 [Lasiosphaeria hispida]
MSTEGSMTSNFQAFNKVLGGRLSRAEASTQRARQTHSPGGSESSLAHSNTARAARRPSLEGELSHDDDHRVSDRDRGRSDDDDSDGSPNRLHRRWRKMGSGISSRRDQYTGSRITFYVIVSRRLQRVIKGLETKVAYRGPVDSEDSYLMSSRNDMMIDEPFHDLFYARTELVRRKDSVEPYLASEIDVVLRFIDEHFASTFAELDGLHGSDTISFRLLWTLFPPKTLVYLRQPTALRDVYHEECRVVQFTGSRCHRVPTLTCVTPQFEGVKPLTSEALQIIPLALVPAGDQKSIKERLEERGRRYFNIFKQPFSVWEYEGPVQFQGNLSFAGLLRSVFSESPPDETSSPGPWIVSPDHTSQP